MAKKKKDQPLTTSQKLGSVVKSCRDIMRKDKGLNGDLDRLPQLTWMMFLKFLDDLEAQDEIEASLADEPYQPLIPEPYRWRDWAADEDGITGDDLRAFINNDEAVRPDGSRGPGLFTMLKSLEGADGLDRRDVVSRVFSGTANRMLNGYLIRDVLNKLNEIHFTSSEELHTLSALYEGMLKEMRDAAGDSGEFYTPRPVVQLMVAVVNPKLGEKVLDPACGTGGFLVEAYEHLKKSVNTPEEREKLQRDTLFGGEAKSLPYLLGEMNLLLHGVEVPNIEYGNSLAVKLSEIGHDQRYDIVLTNPPFGGEEEQSILGNFPFNLRSAETALLFTQMIMRRLKRRTAVAPTGGRCAFVCSDGFLSTKGVHARVKEALLGEFNLHTVVRLPRGVFSPYTPIKTNLVFFDHSGPTEGIWFWEVPPPEGRKIYTKTKPLPFEALDDLREWWPDRKGTESAWYVTREELVERGFDLDLPNPNAPADLSFSPPEEVVEAIKNTSKTIEEHSRTVIQSLEQVVRTVGQFDPAPLGDCLQHRKDTILIEEDKEYQLVTVQLHARGIREREKKYGREIRTKKQKVLRGNDLLVAEIDAKMGGYGLVPPDLAGSIVSGHYYIYEVDQSKAYLAFLELFLRSGLPEIWIQKYVKGSTNYASIRPEHLPLLEMRLPPLEIQKAFADGIEMLRGPVQSLVKDARFISTEADSLLPSLLNEAFGEAAGG